MRKLLLVALLLPACGSDPAPPATEPLRETAPLPRSVEPQPEPTPPDALAPAVAQLSADARTALLASHVAMYVLPATYAARSSISNGESWSALSYRDDELTISLQATTVSHPVLSAEELAAFPPPDSRVRGQPARISINEGIRGVGWNEGEVAYELEVECARPEDDARCTQDAFVLDLAEHLVPFGGMP